MEAVRAIVNVRKSKESNPQPNQLVKTRCGKGLAQPVNNDIYIELKGAYWRILQSPHYAANCPPACVLKSPERHRVQITCNTSGSYHEQHVVCHVVGRDSSAIKFDRVVIAFVIVLFLWLKPLTDERGE